MLICKENPFTPNPSSSSSIRKWGRQYPCTKLILKPNLHQARTQTACFDQSVTLNRAVCTSINVDAAFTTLIYVSEIRIHTLDVDLHVFPSGG
jgi:hypothetical protein